MNTDQARDPLIRTLSRGVADASEGQIMRIVATVDAMAARGAADDLIAPLRHRLVTLRPARPLRFARLVFFPLDPLIVAAPSWKPSDTTIPRIVIAPMAQVVEAAVGPKVAAIKDAIQHRKADDADLVAALGASLWPAAGSILLRSEVPPNWNATGLGDQAYTDLARRIGAVLVAAPALDVICAATAQGLLPPDQAAIAAMIRKAWGLAAGSLPMLVALLLIRLPRSARVLYQIGTGAAGVALKAAADQATGLLLDRLDGEGRESPIAATPLAEAGATAGRLAALLNEMDRDDASAERRKQLHGLRQKLDAACRARFEDGLSTDLLPSLHALPDQPEAADILGVEATARHLRLLESEARALGSGAVYDRLLAQAADTVRAQASSMAPVDRLRLVEILAGSEAAVAMLDQH